MDTSGDKGSAAELSPARLLIVEDDNVQHGLIGRIGSAVGFAPTIARTFEEAVALLRKNKFDCITLDLSLGGGHNGTEVLRLLEELHCKTPIVIVSGATGLQLQLTSSIARSLKLNVCDSIPKPIDPPLLRKTLAKIKGSLPRPAVTGSVA
jgi:two-component system chemotaxis response regulator CheY